MDHIDLEKKIQLIRQSLETELQQSKIVDSKGHATDLKKFEQIVDKKIQELNELESLIADEAGVVTNRYSSNILMHNIELLNNMRKKHSMTTDFTNLSEARAKEEERLNKQSGLSRAKTKAKILINKIITPRKSKGISR